MLNKESRLGGKVLCLLLLDHQAEVSGRPNTHGSGPRLYSPLMEPCEQLDRAPSPLTVVSLGLEQSLEGQPGPRCKMFDKYKLSTCSVPSTALRVRQAMVFSTALTGHVAVSVKINLKQ